MATVEVNAIIEGRRLHGWLAGEGEPTVILEAGLGGTAADWATLQPQVANFARVLSYDRAGLGLSDKAPVPRTCRDIVRDLRSLLSASHLPPPYVLVAHSWSGLNARWYANHYPDEIAGMVLIDAVHEDKYKHFAKAMAADQVKRMWASVQDPARNDETIDRLASIEQVRSSQLVYGFPLTVLTRATDTDALNRIETGLQAEFLKLSPNSRQYYLRADRACLTNES